MSDQDEEKGKGHSDAGDHSGRGNGGNPGHGGGDGNPGHGGGNPGHGDDKVTILVDNAQRRVRGGQWIVSELKAEVGVDPAKILAEITPNGLKDLDDASTVTVREGSRFMSHARTGGSS
ncbi:MULTISPECIES: hypothetical protein [Mesorhizobium]|uniref:Multi-ubiquitin domain-containing protein n=1 Tax=Mesorhizobium album TaxID=3072314 RepID=A0ABU4Y1U5_9HYPH|nr:MULTISPECIES: hypothetical protein [unclassified Mesorhizobium]MDX8480915.1 hypothetical protein [Mesorhizobium sp. VK24D]MDX8515161.1 hypothetical protein [Mesorhizobium sp. VK23E]